MGQGPDAARGRSRPAGRASGAPREQPPPCRRRGPRGGLRHRHEREAPTIERYTPLVGEHTREGLAKARFTEADIKAMIASGAAGAPRVCEGLDRLAFGLPGHVRASRRWVGGPEGGPGRGTLRDGAPLARRTDGGGRHRRAAAPRREGAIASRALRSVAASGAAAHPRVEGGGVGARLRTGPRPRWPRAGGGLSRGRLVAGPSRGGGRQGGAAEAQARGMARRRNTTPQDRCFLPRRTSSRRSGGPVA